MKTKIFYYASSLIIALSAIAILYFYYLTFYPIKIVQLKNFEVSTAKVKSGEYITYKLDFVKYQDVKPTINYYLVDTVIIELDGAGINRPIGQSSPTLRKLIPENTEPGIYTMRIDLTYQVTAWRNINYSWESNEFEVL